MLHRKLFQNKSSVETQNLASLQTPKPPYIKHPPKIGVIKWFRQNTEIYDVWQRGFYEHIIRNEQAYFKISEYINNNPLTWQKDRYYAQNQT